LVGVVSFDFGAPKGVDVVALKPPKVDVDAGAVESFSGLKLKLDEVVEAAVVLDVLAELELLPNPLNPPPNGLTIGAGLSLVDDGAALDLDDAAAMSSSHDV
jgi:hypothetical protein